jgi:hypothetical protein
VPVVGLPGTSSAPLTASLTPSWAAPSWGPPPAPVPNTQQPVRAAVAGDGIDDWLINRLFGRR